MTDITFTPAVLVTGQDARQNDFSWWFSDGKYVDAYNEREVSEQEFRAIFKDVQTVYFSDVAMTRAEWESLQCPLSMSNIQIAAWIENNKHPADVAHEIESHIDAELGQHTIISGGEVLELSNAQPADNDDIPF